MKHFLLLLLLSFAIPGLAQRQLSYFCNEAVSLQQHTADSLLQALDKSQIPTHVLYDRVAGLAALDVFNRVYDDPDTSGVHHFLQAYYELHTADYNNAGTDPCRQVLADNAQYYRERGTVLIGALRYRFNYIDSNAVRNNQLRWDTSEPSLLFDVAGRSGSPYLLCEVAVAAALADSSRTGTVNFRLDPGSIFTNTGAALSSASIDFGDGSPARICTPGQTIAVSYGTPGQKVLRYVLTYADGSQFTTCSSLYVSRAAAYSRGPNFVEPCRIAPLTASIPYQGVAGQAQVSYYYSTIPLKSCGNGAAPNVTKPVILVDGIDYDGTREGGDIYGEYLAYRDGTDTKNLGLELRREGYDVVILDFPNLYNPVKIGPITYQIVTRHSGADYMERNAYTLVTLIQQLNQQMQAAGSTEKIVVVGPSMGGQITRYALAYMESNNMPHNTRLYISLDSPNNGATIPIGLQHFVKYFADATREGMLVNSLATLNSPASRELTLHHHEQGTSFQPDPLRTNFVNTLNGLGGYPSQLRRVAVTDGAIDGTPQSDQNGQVIQAGQQAFGLEQRGIPPHGRYGTIVRILFPIGLLARTLTTAAARVNYAPGYGQTSQVLYAYKIPHGHYQEATGLNGSCGLDGAPGGFRNFFSFASNSDGGLFQKRNFYSVRDKACFIPTLSALGYTQPADNCQPVGQNLVCAGTTPFDAYYGPVAHNYEHLHLTPANVDFMRNEILLKTPAPTFLSAPTAICPNGGTAVFSVATECTRAGQPGTTYTWTAGAGLQMASRQGMATVTVQSTAGYVGTTTLQVVATRTGYVASAPVLVTILVADGYVDTELDLQGAQKVCPYSTVIVRVKGIGVQPPYTWTETHYRNGVPGGTASFTTNDPEYAVSVGDETVDITVTAQSVCTGQNVAEAPRTITPYVDPNGGFYCDPYSFRVAPNPANDYVAVSTRQGNAPPAPPLPNQANPHAFQVRLHDDRGQVVATASTVDGLVRLNTAVLRPGLYHLVIARGRQVVRRNLSVQH